MNIATASLVLTLLVGMGTGCSVAATTPLPQSAEVKVDRGAARDLEILGGIERHLQSTELYITVALALAGIVVTIGGALIAFMQYRWEREHEREWKDWQTRADRDHEEWKRQGEELKRQWEALKKQGEEWSQKVEKRQDDRLSETRLQQFRVLEEWKAATAKEVRIECSKASIADSQQALKQVLEEWRKDAMNQTLVFTQEVLMQTPPARGILFSRFNRLSRDISTLMRGSDSGEEFSGTLHGILWQGLQDWHTLGQLYSVDKNQLMQGLGTLRQHPIAEARDWLQTLRSRYRDDPDIAALVMNALQSFEEAGTTALGPLN